MLLSIVEVDEHICEFLIELFVVLIWVVVSSRRLPVVSWIFLLLIFVRAIYRGRGTICWTLWSGVLGFWVLVVNAFGLYLIFNFFLLIRTGHLLLILWIFLLNIIRWAVGRSGLLLFIHVTLLSIVMCLRPIFDFELRFNRNHLCIFDINWFFTFKFFSWTLKPISIHLLSHFLLILLLVLFIHLRTLFLSFYTWRCEREKLRWEGLEDLEGLGCYLPFAYGSCYFIALFSFINLFLNIDNNYLKLINIISIQLHSLLPLCSLIILISFSNLLFFSLSSSITLLKLFCYLYFPLFSLLLSSLLFSLAFSFDLASAFNIFILLSLTYSSVFVNFLIVLSWISTKCWNSSSFYWYYSLSESKSLLTLSYILS